MDTLQRLSKLADAWAAFRDEVNRTASQLTSTDLDKARAAAARGEPVDPAAFGTLDRIATDFVEVTCRAVPFLASAVLEMKGLAAQRDAAVKALHEIEERTDATHAVCPSCGAARGCDEESDACADGQCNGDHPCEPGCALHAAREACGATGSERSGT